MYRTCEKPITGAKILASFVFEYARCVLRECTYNYASTPPSAITLARRRSNCMHTCIQLQRSLHRIVTARTRSREIKNLPIAFVSQAYDVTPYWYSYTVRFIDVNTTNRYFHLWWSYRGVVSSCRSKEIYRVCWLKSRETPKIKFLAIFIHRRIRCTLLVARCTLDFSFQTSKRNFINSIV